MLLVWLLVLLYNVLCCLLGRIGLFGFIVLLLWVGFYVVF